MNKKQGLILSSFLSLFLLCSLVNVSKSSAKEYKIDEYVPEVGAYFAGKITDPAGLIKAKKFVTPTDNKYKDQKTRSLGSSLIGDIESVWNSYTGKGTTVAIIDDGFDYNHPEYIRSDGSSAILSTSRYYYQSSYSTYYKEYSKDSTCIAEDWDTDYSKWATHGTNTSTTAAAPMNNGGGVGIAPDADILALKIDFSFAAIEAAIDYAITQKVDVINMSLGAYSESFYDGFNEYQEGYSSSANYLESVCKKAYNAGIIVVAAAGNEATWHKSYPACNYKVVGVGALGDYYNKGNASALAEFTNYVSTKQTGEINVDILAPGYVYTATQSGKKTSITHIYDDTQGTSFSSPIVAGAACLWKEKHPNGTPDEFLNQLQSSADGIGYYTSKYVPASEWDPDCDDVGPSNITNGRLNVAKLLDISNPSVTLSKSTYDISVGEKRQIAISDYSGTLSYKSNNTSIATVNSEGLIEGKGAGTTKVVVTASKNGKTATAEATINVADIVATTSISFVPNSISMSVGETYDSEKTIVVTPSNATRLFLFESEDESVAKVDIDTGVITAVGVGTTNINVISGYGDGDDTLSVTVTKASKSTGMILFGKSSGRVNVNSSSITGKDSLNNTWSINTSGTSSFTENDEYSQIGSSKNPASSITFTLTLASASTFSNVTASFGGFSDTAGDISILVDNTKIGSGALNASSDVDVISSKSAVGTTLRISIDNIKKGVKAYSITYSYSDGGDTPVEPTVTSVTVSPSSLSLDLSTTVTGNLSAVVNGTGSPSQKVNWSTSNNAIATVDQDGKVTAIAEGNCTITATSTIDITKSGTCSVTVTKSSISSDTYTIGWGKASEEDGAFKNFESISGEVTNILSFTSAQNSGTNAPFYSSNDSVLRLYYNASGDGDGCSVTIKPDEDYVFTGFVMTAGASNVTVKYSVDGGSKTIVSSDGTAYSASGFNAYSSLTIQNCNTTNVKLNITKIKLTYKSTIPEDKIVKSLSAIYSGGDVYAGSSLDESKVSVSATFTNSTKYPSETLNSNDYSITGFTSSTTGNKTVTVTYTGKLATSVSPMTTTFQVRVIEDSVTKVTASCTKSFHPGDKILKSDLTVTLTHSSGKTSTTSNFTLVNDGYQFVYDDTLGGGSSKTKQFSINYDGKNYSFNVNVSRIAPVSITGVSKTLGSTEFANSNISKSSTSSSTGAVKIDNIDFTVSNAYVYKKDGTSYLSFGKGAGYIQNTNAFASELTEITVGYKSDSRKDGILKISKNGSNYVNYSPEEVKKGGYFFFKLEFTGTSTNYSNITSIKYSLTAADNPTNVANYIMYEDTNNQCTSKLNVALVKLNSMSSADKDIFWNSNDYVISTSRERLLAWARHEGKDLQYTNNKYTLSSFNTYSLTFDLIGDDSRLFISVLSLSSIILLTGLLFIKKKHSNF